jgi:hypothetical protein
VLEPGKQNALTAMVKDWAMDMESVSPVMEAV